MHHLYAAESNDEHLTRSLQDIAVHGSESLAAAVLNNLENALKAGAPMGKAIEDAYERAAAEAIEFVK
jgi:hypothetical protein